MSVEVGQKLTGKVTGITHFGAFVSFPDDSSGLVHISEISDDYVENIKDVLEIGQEVEVRIIKITDDGKLNLSLREERSKASGAKSHKDKSKSLKDKPVKNPVKSKNDQEKTQKQEAKEEKSLSKFDAMMSDFLRDSESRLSDLQRQTDGKRGGRGGRRR